MLAAMDSCFGVTERLGLPMMVKLPQLDLIGSNFSILEARAYP